VARGRRGPPPVRARRGRLCGRAAPRHRRRRPGRLDRPGACVGRRDVRGLVADLRARRHDSHVRRLRRHARPPRVDRRGQGRHGLRGGDGRDDGHERHTGSVRPERPPRDPTGLGRGGLRRPARAAAAPCGHGADLRARCGAESCARSGGPARSRADPAGRRGSCVVHPTVEWRRAGCRGDPRSPLRRGAVHRPARHDACRVCVGSRRCGDRRCGRERRRGGDEHAWRLGEPSRHGASRHRAVRERRRRRAGPARRASGRSRRPGVDPDAHPADGPHARPASCAFGRRRVGRRSGPGCRRSAGRATIDARSRFAHVGHRPSRPAERSGAGRVGRHRCGVAGGGGRRTERARPHVRSSRGEYARLDHDSRPGCVWWNLDGPTFVVRRRTARARGGARPRRPRRRGRGAKGRP
jgi:hypothetical protein